jgi:hypothetical protein
MKIESIHHPSAATSWLTHLLAAGFVGALFGSAGCASSPAAMQTTTLRILIEFNSPIDGAAPDLISRLETLSGVSIRHVAPVSPKLHAYVLVCPAGDPPCDAAIHVLRKDPVVLNISPDQLRKLPQTQP